METVIPPRQTSPSSPTLHSEPPCLFLGERMQILSLSDTAVQYGIRSGEDLRPYLEEGECKRYTACWRQESGTRFDPLSVPQNCAVFALKDFHDFRFMYVEYTYSLRRCSARGYLFSDIREYLAFMDGQRSRCAPYRRFLESLAAAPHSAVPDGAAYASAGEMLSAAMLSLQCFQPHHYSEMEKRRYSLYRLLKNLTAVIAEHIPYIDSRLLLLSPDDPETELFADVNADSFCFLLTALMSTLDDLSENRIITLSVERYGEDREVRLLTECRPLTRRIRHSADLLSLLPFAPTKRFPLTLAEYIAGYSGLDIRILGDDSGMLQLCVYIPAVPREYDFKSPLSTDQILSDALCAARGLFMLFHSHEKKRNDDHVHGPLVLRTQQKKQGQKK